MKNSIVFIFLVVVYRLLLDFIYIDEITPNFDYFLMIDNSTEESFTTSWLLLFSFFPFVLWSFNSKETSIRGYATLLFFLLRVVPYTSFMRFSPQSSYYLFLNSEYWILLFLLLRYWKGFSLRTLHAKTDKPLMLITIGAVGTVLIVSGVYAHFRVHISLDDVYELREEARSFKMPLLLAYFNAATANIIPIVMVYYIRKGKKGLIFLLAFVGLLNFSVAGSKSTLFKIILCLFLVFKKDLNVKKYILPGLLSLCTFCLLEFQVLKTTVLSTLIIRRMFFVPIMLDTLYYNFVHGHAPVFFETEKYRTLSFAIGTEYFGREDMRANNGIFTDAFVNLGSIGCVVFPILIAFLINVCEKLFVGVDKGITIFAVFLIVTTLSSSMLTTSLFTHGLLLLILTVTLVPRKEGNY